MPQDTPGSVSPLAPFEGSFDVPEIGLSRRWMDARDLPPALRDQALEAIDIAFNHDVSWHRLPIAPVDHFDWKYRDRPTGSTIHLTLDAANRVVGFEGTTRRVWWLQGRRFVASAGYDFCRLPEWQGRGVRQAFKPLGGRDEHPSEDFTFQYSSHPADRAAALRRGDRAPANETHDYVRLLRLDPLRRLRDLLNRAASLLPIRSVRPTPPR